MHIAINGMAQAYTLADYRSATLDDEVILYNPDTRRILTINPVFSYLWTVITDEYSQSNNISDTQLTEGLLLYYETSDNFIDIQSEVHLFLQLLIAENFLLLQN